MVCSIGTFAVYFLRVYIDPRGTDDVTNRLEYYFNFDDDEDDE